MVIFLLRHRPLTMFKRISFFPFPPTPFLTVVMNFHQNNYMLGFNSIKTTLVSNNFSMEGWDLGPLFVLLKVHRLKSEPE